MMSPFLTPEVHHVYPAILVQLFFELLQTCPSQQRRLLVQKGSDEVFGSAHVKTMVVFMIVSFFVGAKPKREITDMGNMCVQKAGCSYGDFQP